MSEAYGLSLAPDRIVGDLSAGERQRVEIIRCLLQDPKLLIMDEPTSVLTPQEVEILFKPLRKLSAEGTASNPPGVGPPRCTVTVDCGSSWNVSGAIIGLHSWRGL